MKSLNTSAVLYTYDGDGRRVKKSNGKLYWYGGAGLDALLETDLAGTVTDEYIFFGGKRIARRQSSGAVNYYFADHLGTSRVVVSSAGAILDDSDFYPFGGERIVTSSSGNRYKFTGKERDTESGLDYFGFRYDSSSLGRFMSPDPLTASGRLENPQTWNRYAYVSNNPLNRIDPTGLYDFENTCAKNDKACNKEFKQFKKDFKKALSNIKKAMKTFPKGSLERSRLERVLKAYGKEKQHNGLFVKSAELETGKPARVSERDVINEAGSRRTEQVLEVDSRQISGETAFAAYMGHEGTHVMDNRNSYRSFSTPYMTEYRGYETLGWVYLGLGQSNAADGDGHHVLRERKLDTDGISALIQAHYRNHPKTEFCPPCSPQEE